MHQRVLLALFPCCFIVWFILYLFLTGKKRLREQSEIAKSQCSDVNALQMCKDLYIEWRVSHLKSFINGKMCWACVLKFSHEVKLFFLRFSFFLTYFSRFLISSTKFLFLFSMLTLINVLFLTFSRDESAKMIAKRLFFYFESQHQQRESELFFVFLVSSKAIYFEKRFSRHCRGIDDLTSRQSINRYRPANIRARIHRTVRWFHC